MIIHKSKVVHTTIKSVPSINIKVVFLFWWWVVRPHQHLGQIDVQKGKDI